MTTEEIKEQTNMPELMSRYGISVRRGLCKCPFHDDRSPSMQVFRDGCHCYTCVKSWDVFSFVQDMENVDFKTAYKLLGGTYKEHKTKASKILRDRHFKAQKEANERSVRNRQKVMKELSFCIEVLNETIKIYEPFSDVWCEAQNELPKVFFYWQELLEGREIDQIDANRKCESIRSRFLAI